MERTYFTDAEARTKVGNIVEALADFPSVPKGSKGTVVKVKRYAKDKSAALVEWDLPRQSSFIAAIVLDTSVNFVKRGKPVADEFSKSEYEMLLRVLQPAN
jgi:uncharacterized protein (UPF0303 family)